MKLLDKKRADLDKKFKKVLETPASFAFFMAIHDFIDHIERNAVLLGALSPRVKINRDLQIPTKYNYLKQIYQGIEDVAARPEQDLGHTRYMVIRELHRIEAKDVSDSNSFWKKRELFRKLTGEVYERLTVNFGESRTARKK